MARSLTSVNRLQDLGIECYCRSSEPLKSYPNNPQAAIQIWSVAKNFTANCKELKDWLSRCWRIESQ